MDGPAPASPAAPSSDGSFEGFAAEELRHFYRSLLLPRMIEEKMLVLLRQGRLAKWFSGIGQEAIATGVVTALEPGRLHPADAPQPRRLHRARSRPAAPLPPALRARGRLHQGPRPHLPLRHAREGHRRHDQPPRRDAAGGVRARARGAAARGAARRGGLHRRRRHERGRLPRGAEPGGGLEAARDLRGREQPLGPVDAGARAVRLRHLADRGIGYGMPGLVVDGNDLLWVVRAVRRAAERARQGDGPTLLEFKTYRMRGHEEASGTDYVPKGELDEWAKKDPVRRYEALLVERGLFAEAELRDRSAAPTSSGSTRSPTTRSRPRSRARALRRSSRTCSRRASSSHGRPPRRPRPRRPSCATWTRSATPCASPCGATSGSCSSARTSPSTAASSR